MAWLGHYEPNTSQPKLNDALSCKLSVVGQAWQRVIDFQDYCGNGSDGWAVKIDCKACSLSQWAWP